jgi:hypothetical protein
MNDERFEQKLASELRRVEIPSQLREQLLELAQQPVGATERATSPSRDRQEYQNRAPRRYWLIAVTAAGIVASLWWGWSLVNRSQPPQLVETQRGTGQVESPELTSNAAEGLAELQRLRSLREELELAYQQFEQSEASILSFEEAEEARSPKLAIDDELLKAETIFWTAETSLFSGYKTDGVRAQLLYVISEFPESAAAQRAKSLLANF